MDLARQEVKVLGQQQERLHREHAKRVTELTTQRDALQAAVRTAEQMVAHQEGQITALEATINQWRHMQTGGTKRRPGKVPPAPKGKAGRPRAKASP